jgi:hypothetical protein
MASAIASVEGVAIEAACLDGMTCIAQGFSFEAIPDPMRSASTTLRTTIRARLGLRIGSFYRQSADRQLYFYLPRFSSRMNAGG